VNERATGIEAPSIREESDAEGRVEQPKKKRGLFDFFNFGGGKKPPKPDNNRGKRPGGIFHR